MPAAASSKTEQRLVEQPHKKALLRRMNRIGGQVQGITRMIAEVGGVELLQAPQILTSHRGRRRTRGVEVVDRCPLRQNRNPCPLRQRP